MTKNVDVKKFESNGEVFEIGSYHEISILIRKSDGYINATKLCSQFESKSGENKRFRNIIQTQTWQEFYEAYFDEFQENSGSAVFPADLIYMLKHKFSNDAQGQYIHPKLINTLILLVRIKR